ncbi:MAG: enoyl-CoA hydratase/isomerase family protein [Phycisphaeraceae bacterium]|nr:enoyl-CoA hydratase/isomerase family protein [Phycisphaeraceae bacterium]
MTALRTVRDADGVVTLTLDINPAKPRGGTVVLDGWLIEQIRVALDAIRAGPAPSGFILESASTRVFVAGADIAELDGLSDPQLAEFLKAGSHAFGLIRELKCPSVAIVHKAALGGGFELPLHCDALIGVRPAAGEKPWRIGLAEATLGVCPGWGGTQMLPARIDPATAILAASEGRLWEATQVPDGLFEATADTIDDARVLARKWLAAQHNLPLRPLRAIDHTNSAAVGKALTAVRSRLPDTEVARAVAECVHAGIQNGFAAALELEQRELIRLRHTPPAREKMAAFLKK